LCNKAGESQALLLAHARGALKRKTEELAASLEGDLSAPAPVRVSCVAGNKGWAG
jgi:hypothetical protein